MVTAMWLNQMKIIYQLNENRFEIDEKSSESQIKHIHSVRTIFFLARFLGTRLDPFVLQ